MKIIAIAAVDTNWAIGKKNGLLYKLPEDLKHFKKITENNFVVCGYNTLLSFPKQKALPNRITICIGPKDVKRDDCIMVSTLEEALSVMEENSITPETKFYIIGGGMIYKSFLPYYDEAIITKVEASDPEASVFFPNLDNSSDFIIKETTDTLLDNGYKTQYILYERKTNGK